MKKKKIMKPRNVARGDYVGSYAEITQFNNVKISSDGYSVCLFKQDNKFIKKLSKFLQNYLAWVEESGK